MSVSAALGAIGFVTNIIGQRKQAKAQKRAAREQQRARRVEAAMASRENARRRRQAIREARIQRGEVIASGANQGVLGSSGVQGGASSITAQAGGNIANINEMEGMSLRRNMFLNAAAGAQSDANKIGATFNMMNSVFSVGANVAKEYKSFQQSPAGQRNTFIENNPSWASVSGAKKTSFLPSVNNIFGS